MCRTQQTLLKPITSSAIKELETKAAPRLTANEKLHNPHSGVHKTLLERSAKLTTEDPNVQLNSVRGILNTPAHTWPTALATPASNKRGETTNNEEDCQSPAEVLRSTVTWPVQDTKAKHHLAYTNLFKLNVHISSYDLIPITPSTISSYSNNQKPLNTLLVGDNILSTVKRNDIDTICRIQTISSALDRKMAVSMKKSGLQLMEEVHKNRIKTAESIADFKFCKQRVQVRSKSLDVPEKFSSIVYWMSREQRVQDNWALLFAQRLALKNRVPLKVVFCLVPSFMDATLRHYTFMIQGLKEVESDCKELGIPFHLLLGQAKDVLPSFVTSNDVGGVVTDYSPLKTPKQWVADVLSNIPEDIPLCQVDGHNVVPVWEASPKQEYAARTIRRKITDKLSKYLTEFPPLIPHPHKDDKDKNKATDWKAVEASLDVDTSVGPVKWACGGTRSAFNMLASFCSERLKKFSEKRNDPNEDALSNLSPWIHFGHISAARCVLEVQKQGKTSSSSVAAYVEECVIRRELSDNFCHYQPHYDSLLGTSDWARITLDEHRKDKREKLYSLAQLDRAKTYDDLWNAAQVQLVTEGKMHGFLRMYWAKKILEWTPDPDSALAYALYLNDRYSLDGRDPNGFVGCLWSVGGLHDQGWRERAVFGKIRYMNYAGCNRKMNIKAFVAKYKVTDDMPGATNVKTSLKVVSTANTVSKKKPDELKGKEEESEDAEEIQESPKKRAKKGRKMVSSASNDCK
ncbi:DNA photolyase class 2 [Trinorchestia longiramus]|nr:DNA photolyase class 2 [Trinorchestia longiramus]